MKTPKKTNGNSKPKKKEESESEEDTPKNLSKKANGNTEKKKLKTEESDSEEEEDKNKFLGKKKAISKPTKELSDDDYEVPVPVIKKTKDETKSNVPFKRIDDNLVNKIKNDKLKDNTYDVKFLSKKLSHLQEKAKMTTVPMLTKS